MLDKGILGWEIDLLAAIRWARGNFEIKYIKQREYGILTAIIPVFTDNMYLKPVMMLSLQPTFAGRHIAKLKANTAYQDMIFDSNNRAIIDRTLFYDAFIFYILELDKYIEIDETAAIKLMYADISHTNNSSRRIFFNRFSYMKLDSKAEYKTKIAKKQNPAGIIRNLAKYIRSIYKSKGINYVQAYTKQMTGPIMKDKFHHKFTNFSASGKLPNPLLQSMKQYFYTVSQSAHTLPPPVI